MRWTEQGQHITDEGFTVMYYGTVNAARGVDVILDHEWGKSLLWYNQ